MESTIAEARSLRSWLVLALLSLIWGTSYLLIKKGLVVYSPVQVACLRLTISTIAFLPIFLHRLRRVDWSRFSLFLLVGLTGTALPAFLFATAQTEVSSSVAGMLNSLSPLFTLVLGIAFFQSAAPLSKITGVVLGLLGAALLIFFSRGLGQGGNPWYGLLIVVATVCYAISTNVVGSQLRHTSSLTISAVSFCLVGLPAALYLLIYSGFPTVLATEPGAWRALGFITLLALGSTVLASVFYFKLIQWTSPVFGSTVSYVVPAVAVLWGAFDGERITWVHVGGLVLILLGVYLSRK